MAVTGLAAVASSPAEHFQVVEARIVASLAFGEQLLAFALGGDVYASYIEKETVVKFILLDLIYS